MLIYIETRRIIFYRDATQKNFCPRLLLVILRWLFCECKLLANMFHTHHIYLFNTRYVTGRLTPYWMAVKFEKQETDLAEFHRVDGAKIIEKTERQA